ncbi:MAG: hypothetical protein GIW98_04445 [Candidatus Eremiobacteraeota bacterium]|nr:hypothetical protein [Candidatus Eremiobacteraeota bacterium]
MMKALCCCDNRQINDAVQHYVGELDDTGMIELLRVSQAYLDPYHLVVLQSLLNDARMQTHSDGGQIKTLFQSFVAANPRALEQLPAAIIEGILLCAATSDTTLRRQLTPAWFQRYAVVLSGMAGVLTAATVMGYMYFGVPKVEDSAFVPPSISLKSVVTQHPALVAVVHKPARHERRAIAIFHRNTNTQISVATSSHSPVAVAMTQGTRSDVIAKPSRRQPTRQTSKEHGINHKASAAAALPTAARPQQPPPIVARAPIPSAISEKTVAVEMKVVTQTVESSEPEASTQATDPAPARYCYARGSWRAC